MKKIISIIILISTIIMMCSCNDKNTTDEASEGTTDARTTIYIEDCDGGVRCSFDNYEDLYEGLTNPKSEKYILMHTHKEGQSEVYKRMLDDFSSGKLYVPAPQISGNNLLIEEFDAWISVASVVSYGSPCIWYHSMYKGKQLHVKILPIAPFNNEALNNAKTYLEAMLMFTTRYPNLDNYETHSLVDYVCEKTVKLADGKEYTALFYDVKDDVRNRYHILKDGMMIDVWGEPDVVNEEFFAKFDVVPYEKEE